MDSQKEDKSIKLIVVDLGGVLFDFYDSISYLSEISHVPLEKCEQIWKKHDDQICRGQQQPEIIWEEICQISTQELPKINFINSWVSHFKPFKDMSKFIVMLSCQYKIGVLTNIFPGAFKKMIDLKKIPDISYSCVIESCDVGKVKPELEIYQYVESKSGHRAGEILFIDDNPKNLIPAIDMGWATIHYDRTDKKLIKKVKEILK